MGSRFTVKLAVKALKYFNEYVPKLTSICECHSVNNPYFLLVEIANVVTKPMLADYVLTFVDSEIFFYGQRYDLIGVGYLVYIYINLYYILLYIYIFYY